MSNLRIYLLILFSFCVFQAEAQKYFNKVYPNALEYTPTVVLPMPDGYLIYGNRNNSLLGVDLLKINLKGDTVWSKRLLQSYECYASNIKILSDNTLIAVGVTNKSIIGNWDIFLLKLNKDDGSIIWTKHWMESSSDYVTDISEGNDGGFVIAGFSDTSGTNKFKYSLIKTDAAGNIQWKKKYGFPNSTNYAHSIVRVHDGYVVGGYSGLNSDYNLDVMKFNNDGDLLWKNSCTRSLMGYTYGGYVTVLRDSNLLIAGAIEAGKKAYIAKISASTGDTIWEKKHSLLPYYIDFNTRPIENSDGTIVIGGSFYDSPNDKYVMITKMKSDGDTIWTRKYYTKKNLSNRIYDIKPTTDGGYVFAGTGDDFTTWDLTAWLVKLDCMGADSIHYYFPGSFCPTGITEITSKLEDLNVYPNPFSDHTTVQYSLKPKEKGILQLFDIQGKLIKEYAFRAGQNRHTISAEDLNNGFYLCNLVIDGIPRGKRKIVVIKK